MRHNPIISGITRIWRVVGPGTITGAADDDPSGIATYSQAGAQFGYALTWTMFLTLPFMAAIQLISALIGWRTRNGLMRNIVAQLPKPVVYALLVLLVTANTINIAADLAAMGESLRLVIPGSALLFSVLFGVICLVAEVFVPYHSYAGYLKFLTLVLLCYVATAFSIAVPWLEVLSSTFIPQLRLDRESILVIVAVFGTTISPYLFFWQASQEAEEARLQSNAPKPNSRSRRQYFSRISADTWAGMVFSNLIAFFIIVTTAATLSARGITHIDTAAQAAEALRPIAGNLTFALFSAGIIGTGLLAVPVLAGSAAYAVTDSFGIKGSLDLPANRALGFYGIVSAATLAGAAIPLTHIDPIAMLFWTAVINGVIAVPIMAATMHVVSSRRGRRTLAIPRWLRVLGWMATGLMALALAAFAWLNV